MNYNQKLLSSIVETAQMGQIGIRAALRADMKHTLRLNLQSQLREYDEIEADANRIAASRCWDVRDIDPAAKFMAKATARGKLSFGDVNSKIAAMMIQGNTKGMIKGLKNLHQFPRQDDQVSTISQKLLDCETANIRQMQSFL